MSNLVFPSLPGVAITRTRTPVWKSTVQESVSGRTIGLSASTYPRWKYKLSFEFLRSDAHQELQAIIALFNRMHGRADTFLFQDDDDYTVASQQIGIGDGATTNYQLLRSVGGFVEPVAEVSSLDLLTVGGVRQDASLDAATDATLSLDFLADSYQVWQNDYAYAGAGRVVLATPPAAGQSVVWSGSYYQRCRFDADVLDIERFLWQLWSAKSVEFTTVKS